MPLSTLLAERKEPNSAAMQKQWSPSSWRQKEAKQQPVYADQAKHKKALEKLETLPPLVTASEVVHFATIY